MQPPPAHPPASPPTPPRPIVCAKRNYSGAQLANLINVAATEASRRGAAEIHHQDIVKVRPLCFVQRCMPTHLLLLLESTTRTSSR